MDAGIAGNHGAAAPGPGSPVEGDDGDAADASGVGDLVADSKGRDGDFGDDEIGLVEPREIASADVGRVKGLTSRADMLGRDCAGQGAVAFRLERFDDPLIE